MRLVNDISQVPKGLLPARNVAELPPTERTARP